MHASLIRRTKKPTIPIVVGDAKSLDRWLRGRGAGTRRWAEASGFTAKPGAHCLLPDGKGKLAAVLVGSDPDEDPFALGALPSILPGGIYRLELAGAQRWPPGRIERASLGWALGAYRFSRYKRVETPTARLLVDKACDWSALTAQVDAVCLVRDLINTPAEDMMPEQLGEAMAGLAREHDAKLRQVTGAALLAKNYPAIHAVGRAASHPPRLLDLGWGRRSDPQVVLVGKGVCFDSGGLDLKTATGMRYMKKDMGGAAHVIGLGKLIMASKLPVRLRVLVAAVENAVAGNAYRPGDIIRTRSGKTVEIDNTDAEGRVVLSDALDEASASAPALVVDFATLTGAARVALGTDLPAMFCNDDELAGALLRASAEVRDPVWRMPLHRPYRELIDSRVADIVNSGGGPYAGAVTAALFLQEFVAAGIPWVHFDLMAWNTRDRPGRPEGGEAMGLRAVFEYLRQRYSSAG